MNPALWNPVVVAHSFRGVVLVEQLNPEAPGQFPFQPSLPNHSGYLLATDLSWDISQKVSTMDGIDMPPPHATGGNVQSGTGTWGYHNRAQYAYSKGTKAASGSISFALTKETMWWVKEISNRGAMWRLYWIPENEDKQWVIPECYMTSMTITGSVNGLMTGQVSFLCRPPRHPDGVPTVVVPSASSGIDVPAPSLPPLADTPLKRVQIGPKLRAAPPPVPSDSGQLSTQVPYAYWHSGTDLDGNGHRIVLREWTLTVNQEVSPVYGNIYSDTRDDNDPTILDLSMWPMYYRIGNLDVSLSFTTYLDSADIRSMWIASNKIKLKTGYLENRSVTMSEQDTWSHSFKGTLMPEGGNTGTLIDWEDY